MNRVWQVRLADQAERDLITIADWTAKNFGSRQANHYLQTVSLALEALHDDPNPRGYRARSDIGPGICTLHVARQGRKGRHFVIFKEAEGHAIDVLRLLHDSMELARHIPLANDQPD
ncbi:MAG: type II toxin-antitoxin system RelE/ParE family toxin [Burkholderiales bacterium]|nr:type II toxin-antitoxin system RelE/ParE family toxin [Burkholderiales bacterium]MCA3161962.1 type II toxin-antitoxin system RelE/ParE family toxin [Burkholderiales bacterium]MCA3164884.1 type II toxin-antitoxin system RelE/ParE family toxin [Burkholderiales bacterium]MCA3169478.1 type II toxin-antitoxin system RelE/ParE family toxin [Burkholderiales bacterium]MCA3171538.1 type II toxin-antitoxin system RelE/ParE family toxin [Burkholderiales bacterium]